MNPVANTVAVVDYGMGNLRSVSQAVQAAPDRAGVKVIITSRPEEVRAATRVVLPGQGAMPDCMRELRESGLLESVLEAAATKPLFGVCVGMQMLLDHSAEGDTPGLGLIPGEVVKFDLAGRLQPDGSRFKVPRWAGTRWPRPSLTCCGPMCLTTAISILCTVSTRVRPTRATVWAKRTTAGALPRPLPAIIFLPPSSTPKRAQATA